METSLALHTGEYLRGYDLREVDLTNNHLATFPPGVLPDGIHVLRLTGNQLTRPPPDVNYYAELRELYMGSNCLADVKWVFQCPSLLHAGFACNAVASLPFAIQNHNLVRRPCFPPADQQTGDDEGGDELALAFGLRGRGCWGRADSP